MPCKSFYWRKEQEHIWREAKATAKREGKRISNLIAEYLEQYVRLHEPGNPQQRLDVIMKLGKAYHAPNPICGFKDCLRDAVAVGVYLSRGEEYGLCAKHLAVAKLDEKAWLILKRVA